MAVSLVGKEGSVCRSAWRLKAGVRAWLVN